MAAGKGPGPPGTCKSSSKACPATRPYSTFCLSTGAAARTRADANASATTCFCMERLYQRHIAETLPSTQQHQRICCNLAMRSSVEGWVENRFISDLPVNGLMMNMCAVD